MKWIKSKSAVKPITGSIVDTTNIEDKTTNTYSANVIDELIDSIFPIGYTFIDVLGTKDYSNHLGFTWQKTLQGVTPVGQKTSDTDFATIGKTGGAKTHFHTQAEWTGDVWLSVAQMPAHTHGDRVTWGNASTVNTVGVNGVAVTASSANGMLGIDRTGGSTGSQGGNQPHAHTLGSTNSSSSLQPYQVVAFWTRIA